MKVIFEKLYRALTDTALLFTAIIMFFAKLIFSTNTKYLDEKTLTSFFLFSLVFGLAGFINLAKKLPSFVRYLIRLVLTAAGYVVFVLLKGERSESQMFVGALVFVFFYVVISLVAALIKKLVKKG